MMPLTITRMDDGQRTTVHQPATIARAFFDWDALSRRYDARAMLRADPDRLTRDDLTAVNTLGAHQPASAWAGLLGVPLAWLQDISPDWDLLDTDENREAVDSAMSGALSALSGRPHLGLAGATKMLHLKRPRLFPIADALVVDFIGGRARPTMDVIRHLRAVGRANRQSLSEIETGLRAAGIVRTPVRILDALIWSLHPGSGFASHLLVEADVTWRSS